MIDLKGHNIFFPRPLAEMFLAHIIQSQNSRFFWQKVTYFTLKFICYTTVFQHNLGAYKLLGKELKGLPEMSLFKGGISNHQEILQ